MLDQILHDFLDDKIAEIKSDPSILEDIFEGYPTETIESIKQYLLNNEIKTVYHFPRDASQLPCYAIVLENTAESEFTIGMSGDTYDEVELSTMEDGWIGSDSNILVANLVKTTWTASTVYTIGKVVLPTTDNEKEYVCSTAGTSGATEPTWATSVGLRTTDGTATWICRIAGSFLSEYYGPSDILQYYSSLEVKNGRRSCHLIGKKDSSVNKGIWIDFQNSVLGNKNLSGYKYIAVWIKSSRTGSFMRFGYGEKGHEEYTYAIPVTVKNLWQRIRIDISGVADRNRDDVRYMSFKITNDDLETDVYLDTLTAEEEYQYVHREAYFDNNYRIESWTNNAEFTLNLWKIASWNLLKYRDYLEQTWGMYLQKITGGDIMPQPDYYPEFVYIRALNHNCLTVETIPTEEKTALDVQVGRTDFGE